MPRPGSAPIRDKNIGDCSIPSGRLRPRSLAFVLLLASDSNVRKSVGALSDGPHPAALFSAVLDVRSREPASRDARCEHAVPAGPPRLARSLGRRFRDVSRAAVRPRRGPVETVHGIAPRFPRRCRGPAVPGRSSRSRSGARRGCIRFPYPTENLISDRRDRAIRSVRVSATTETVPTTDLPGRSLP